MRVFVTGATGFVGGHLVPELLSRGYEVTCLVRSEEKAEKLKGKWPGIHAIIGDITEADSLKKIKPEGYDYVIHLAAMGHVASISKEDYIKFTAINEGGTKNLIEVFKRNPNLKRFVHISSSAAMGFNPSIPVLNEKTEPNPVTPYQKSKRNSELISLQASKDGVPTVIVRPCMIYGPGGYGEFYKFASLMNRGVFPKVGLGKNLTPLVHVEDVVSGLICAMEKGRSGEIYIIASETSIEMDQLRRHIVNSLGVSKPYIYVPGWMALIGAKVLEKLCAVLKKEPIVSSQNIRSTIADRTFDITKAKDELGYVPRVSFETGIKETIDWYRQQGRFTA